MATKPDDTITTYRVDGKSSNTLKDGQLDPIKHDVRVIVDASPETKMPMPRGEYSNQSHIEHDVAKLLDEGYVLANFNSVCDQDGHVVCVAVMIKVPS